MGIEYGAAMNQDDPRANVTSNLLFLPAQKWPDGVLHVGVAHFVNQSEFHQFVGELAGVLLAEYVADE